MKRIVLMLIILIAIFGCSNRHQKPGQNNYKDISILQFGPHPVINEIVSGTEHQLIDLFGKNTNVKIYNGNFDMGTISNLSRQMLAQKNDLIISVTTPASSQLIGINRGQIPLVFTFVSNPEDVGYFGKGSLKNTTGLSDKVEYDSTLKLIRRLMPNAKNIGYLITRSESNAIAIMEGFRKAAPKYNFELTIATISQPTDIRMAVSTVAPKVDLFLFGGDNSIASAIEVLINTSRDFHKPTFACDAQSIERGAIAGYSVDYYQMGVETANLAFKILNGCKPDSIPVVEFKASNLIINLKTAKNFPIILDSSLLKKAFKIYN